MKRSVLFLLTLVLLPVSGFPETGRPASLPEAILVRAGEKALDLYRRLASELDAQNAVAGAEAWAGVRGADPSQGEIYGGVAIRTPFAEGSLNAGLQKPGTANRFVPGLNLSVPILDGYPGGRARRLDEDRAAALGRARLQAIRELRGEVASAFGSLRRLLVARNDYEIAEAAFEAANLAAERDDLLPDSVSARNRRLHADEKLLSGSVLAAAADDLSRAERDWEEYRAFLGTGFEFDPVPGEDDFRKDAVRPEIGDGFSSPDAGRAIPAQLDENPRRLELLLELGELKRSRETVAAAGNPTLKLGLDVHGVVQPDGSLLPFFGLELKAGLNFYRKATESEAADRSWTVEERELEAELAETEREEKTLRETARLNFERKRIAYSLAASVRKDGLEDERLRTHETRADAAGLKARTASRNASLRNAWLELVRAWFESRGIEF